MESLTPDRPTLIEMYRKIALIKQTDERFRSMIRAGKLAIPYYSPRGQEVIPSAFAVNMREDDYLVTIYRGLHDQLAKGVPLKMLWAEFAGRATGSCKGKGGPMHITHPATGVMVTTGIVGSSMPIANGLAWASQLQKTGRVTVATFGDGASNIGAFHEALNLAAVWKLPVVFICQNNGYAEHTHYRNCTSVENVADRASSYSIPGIIADGNDPLEMWRVCKEAIDRARNGGGPTLIEAKTFRFFGHALGDDDSYMAKGEKDAWMQKDPVPRYRAWLIEQGHATEADLAGIEAATEKELDEAVEFAMSSPYPDLSELHTDVYGSEVPA